MFLFTLCHRYVLHFIIQLSSVCSRWNSRLASGCCSCNADPTAELPHSPYALLTLCLDKYEILLVEIPTDLCFHDRFVVWGKSEGTKLPRLCATFPGSSQGMPQHPHLLGPDPECSAGGHWASGCITAPLSHCCLLLQFVRGICPCLGHRWGPSWIGFPRKQEHPAHATAACPKGALCSWHRPGDTSLGYLSHYWHPCDGRELHVLVYLNHGVSRGSSRTCSLSFGFQTSSFLGAEVFLT